MVGWQVPVCGLIIILPAIGALSVIFRVETPRLNASDLWKPCWKGLNPLWLLLYRALVFSFMSCLLYRVAAIDGPFAFYFYTQWTFALVIIYFALGIVISAHGCWEHLKRPSIKDEEQDVFLRKDPEEGQPTVSLASNINNFGDTIMLQHHQEEVTVRAGFWGYLMQIIYQTCAGAVMLTDIVFWCLLFPFQSGGGFDLTLVSGPFVTFLSTETSDKEEVVTQMETQVCILFKCPSWCNMFLKRFNRRAGIPTPDFATPPNQT